MPAAPELFERDAEVAKLLDTCRLASESNGAVIAVRGAPGIGKTALLDRAGRAAAADGLRVLNASGTELERELGFGVVRQLLEPLVLELSPAARDELFQGAAALAAPVVLPTQGGRADAEAVPAALHGLYWLTAGLASRSPLLLVVDDAHWADAASLRWLAYLARRLHGSPMSLILGYRPAEPGADMTLLEQVLSEADA